MVSNKMSFMPEFLIHFIKYNTYGKEDLIKIEILKNQLNHQLNIVILNNFAATKYFFKYFFFLHKFVASQFFKKINLNITCIPTEMNQNLLHLIFFVSFAKLLNISSDESSLFHSQVNHFITKQ